MSLTTFYGPVVFVDNVQVAAKFYERVLDQVVKHDFGNNISFESGLSLWQIGDQLPVSKFLKGRLGTKNSPNKFELYFETENIVEVYKKAIIQNVDFLHKLLIEPWGQKTFRFFDPDKNLIEVGESIPAFVIRLYNQGISVHEVADYTGIPESSVKEIISNSRN
jgi:catechol 2,3-dioxygenase-like lactoylglutathione lyase family enzyme